MSRARLLFPRLPVPYRVRRYREAAAFLERAEAWLLGAEVEHNLLLGIARRLTQSAEGFDPPVYLATVEEDDTLVGCAFRTPPYKLGLTRMPAAALPALVGDVAAVYDSLPAVLGPEPVVRSFAERWSEQQGVRARPGMRQRIYRLTRVTPPEHLPPGRMRPAGPEDVGLTARWMAAFRTDTGVPVPASKRAAQDLIARGALFLWEDGRPASMAGWTGRTPNGARVAYVYTPPGLRGRGYATALVAALSRHLLESGLSYCALYTDLSNPTSNRIYQRIGYEPVCDVMDCHFEG